MRWASLATHTSYQPKTDEYSMHTSVIIPAIPTQDMLLLRAQCREQEGCKRSRNTRSHGCYSRSSFSRRARRSSALISANMRRKSARALVAVATEAGLGGGGGGSDDGPGSDDDPP